MTSVVDLCGRAHKGLSAGRANDVFGSFVDLIATGRALVCMLASISFALLSCFSTLSLIDHM